MKALILVDFQNEWIDNKSEYYVGDISEVLEKTKKLIEYCRSKNYKIIFTKHVEEEGEFTGQNAEIIDELKKDEDILIIKNKINPFYKTDLEKHLTEEIVVCGILTNLCVRSLIQDAYDRDFKITVIKDCCVSFDQETQDFTFKDLKATREEIEFLDTNEFIK